jgi:hypothetical protein
VFARSEMTDPSIGEAGEVAEAQRARSAG